MYYGDFQTNNVNEVSQKNKKISIGKKVRNAVVSGAVFGLSAGLVFTGVSRTAGGTREENAAKVQLSTTTGALATAVADKSTEKSYTVQEIAAKCMSSVVSISCTSVESVQSFFGGTRQYQSNSAGSGIVVASDGEKLYIATNNHVVDGANEISVCFNDSEEQVYEAETKGTDANNDLAIVAISLSDIPEDVRKDISIATLGNSDSAQIGEQVVAIGNALGYGQSVTSGYISALNREVKIDNLTANLIQTDAAINPGNSGGALFNMYGEVIGINSAKFSSEEVEGMGYAIPVSVAEPILEQLMTMDKVEEGKQGVLEISAKDVSTEVSEMYDIPKGVFVDEVSEDGAADKAGIKKGDIITNLEERTVSDTSTLKSLLQYYEAGDKVEVTIQRRSSSGYEEKTLKVTLSAAEENTEKQNGNIDG